jgi:hypothetical protein
MKERIDDSNTEWTRPLLGCDTGSYTNYEHEQQSARWVAKNIGEQLPDYTASQEQPWGCHVSEFSIVDLPSQH